eukprot:sb/3476115/
MSGDQDVMSPKPSGSARRGAANTGLKKPASGIGRGQPSPRNTNRPSNLTLRGSPGGLKSPAAARGRSSGLQAPRTGIPKPGGAAPRGTSGLARPAAGRSQMKRPGGSAGQRKGQWDDNTF